MQTFPVRFAGGTGFALRSDADKGKLLAEMRSAFGVDPVVPSGSRRYSGAEHARDLRRSGGRYVAALRPRGIPQLLYLTRVEGAGVALFVDRRVSDGHFYPRMVLVRLGFADRVFDGTAVEGDLVRLSDGVRWVFLASDLRAYCGRDARGQDAIRRLKDLSELVSPATHRPDLVIDPCFVRARQHFSVARLREVIEGQVLKQGALDYEVAAVVFKALGQHDGDDIVFSVPRAVHQQHTPASGAAEAAQASPAATLPPPHVEDAMTRDEEEDDEVHGLLSDDGEEEEEEEEEVVETIVRDFFVRRTQLPDVYELYNTYERAQAGEPGAPIAGVPTMRDSVALREAPPGVAVAFEWSARFERWTLCRRI